MPSIEAIIAGLEQASQSRIENKQIKAVYLHTSGTGELVDNEFPLGELDETVYDDADLKQIEASESSLLPACTYLPRWVADAWLGSFVVPETRDHRKETNKYVALYAPPSYA